MVDGEGGLFRELTLNVYRFEAFGKFVPLDLTVGMGRLHQWSCMFTRVHLQGLLRRKNSLPT